MPRMANEKEETSKDQGKVLFFLLISAAFLMAEIGFMDLSMMKAPVFIQTVYDKVTLPSPLHFITYFKGLFALFMYLLSCVPALLLMGGTGMIMARVAEK